MPKNVLNIQIKKFKIFDASYVWKNGTPTTHTCVLVGIDGNAAGAYAVTDTVIPEASIVILYLHSMNNSSVMVTTDNRGEASEIAREVGNQNVFAETDPLGKAKRIKYLQVTLIHAASIAKILTSYCLMN